jgi:hypothetical protein
MKTQILTAIGETGLQREVGLNAALAANDRLKYRRSPSWVPYARDRAAGKSSCCLARRRGVT